MTCLHATSYPDVKVTDLDSNKLKYVRNYDCLKDGEEMDGGARLLGGAAKFSGDLRENNVGESMP